MSEATALPTEPQPNLSQRFKALGLNLFADKSKLFKYNMRTNEMLYAHKVNAFW